MVAFRATRTASYFDVYDQGSRSEFVLASGITTVEPRYLDREGEAIISSFIASDASNSLYEVPVIDFTVHLLGDLGLSGFPLFHSSTLETTGVDPTQDPTGICSNIEDLSDGGGGRLWKHSEKGGTVYLHPTCDGRVSTIHIMKDGNDIAEMYASGLANPDGCGNREHFRHARNPWDFPNNIVLRVKLKNGQTHCYSISNAAVRND